MVSSYNNIFRNIMSTFSDSKLDTLNGHLLILKFQKIQNYFIIDLFPIFNTVDVI